MSKKIIIINKKDRTALFKDDESDEIKFRLSDISTVSTVSMADYGDLKYEVDLSFLVDEIIYR